MIRKSVKLTAWLMLLYAATIPLNFSLRDYFLRDTRQQDIFERVFGGFRAFIGDWSFMKAEEYHHLGLSFTKALAFHEGESSLMGERGQDGKGDEHHHRIAAEPAGFFAKLYSKVKVTEDSHINPAEEKEVLPWFYVEVMFNPHDIRGYVLGSYWLGRLGKHAEQIRLLEEGERNNPSSAQILGALGSIYFYRGEVSKALTHLERARNLWIEGKFPNDMSDKYQETDRLITLHLIGTIYEKAGRRGEAIKVYEELDALQPAPVSQEKIRKLNEEPAARSKT
jgi:tetratricopeptide (TPR) repeat protein